MNADLQTFVREALGRGIPRPAVAQKLREAGWRAEEIESALAAWAETEFPVPVPKPRPYLSAREAFLYLVLFATLYTTAFNTGAVLFALLDRWLPDPGDRWENARRIAEAVRGGTAGLLIAFPIFLLLSAGIGRSVSRDPEKRGSKVRKWLTYVTLFVAAMVLIGGLTFLVSRLLSGEIATRVLLKVLVVLAIAGITFSHYLGELRRDEREGAAPTRTLRAPPRLVAAVVLLVLVAGLVAGGSPRRERQRRLDVGRIEDLQSLNRRVDTWVSGHGSLPASLEDLAGDPSATGQRFRDPVTGAWYGYRVLDSLRYELCADFAAADSVTSSSDETAVFWRHSAGRTCYALRVDAWAWEHRGGREPVKRP